MRARAALAVATAAITLIVPAIAHAKPPASYLGPTEKFAFPEPGPGDIAVAPDGSFYVTIGNDVQRHDANGALTASWLGAAPGAGAIAIDQLGNVYVADRGANLVRKFAPGGALLAAWDGFEDPSDLAAGPSGLLVADRQNRVLDARLQLRSLDGALLATRGGQGSVAQSGDGQLWFRSELLAERLSAGDLSTVFAFSHDAPDRESNSTDGARTAAVESQ